jgi:hypothetical protein
MKWEIARKRNHTMTDMLNSKTIRAHDSKTCELASGVNSNNDLHRFTTLFAGTFNLAGSQISS